MTTSTSVHGPTAGRLAVEVVGSDLVVVAAIGSFTSASFDEVASRLAKLIAGAPARVRVDCRRVTSMVPEIADLFVRAAAMVASRGGELELTSVPPAVRVASRPVAAGGSAAADPKGRWRGDDRLADRVAAPSGLDVAGTADGSSIDVAAAS